jgi:hypothetical protein
VSTFGCFSYAWLSSDRIRLHFHDAERDGLSPLGRERRDRRLADLAALFASLKHSARKPIRVVGASWLYNITAYRRLFPESYLATARVVQHRFRHMPLWGQFVNRYGDGCFPFQMLSLEAPVVEFYDFYGV